MQWTRKPQEQEGTYMFSGKFYVTQTVMSALSPDDITFIYLDIKKFVKENNGADYLQIYENGTGERLYLIDQLSCEMIESGSYEPENNYCTLLFSWEY